MKTRKPLRELIPDILLHYRRYWEQMQFELELYKMHEGQIKSRVEESLAKEMLSKAAYKRAIQRIPSINIPRKVTDKLSKVYSQAPIRFAEKDIKLIEEFAEMMHLNAEMGQANRMGNLNHRSALEIYMEEGRQKVRVLNAHQFLPYSDSPTSPNTMTVFIKLLGREPARREVVADRSGRRNATEDEITMVDIFALYSDDEFMIVDSGGGIRQDKMREIGATTTKNPFGIIPFVYINTSHSELVPYPNQTAHDIGILIPKLLTDLNYSAQFLSHSVIWTKNASLEGAEINPDAIVDLGDTDANGNTPEIGTIEPKTDITGVLKLIEFQVSSYLATVGIKAGTIGQAEATGASSGIAKIIDESDTTEVRKQQTALFRMVEPDFWNKFSKMQAVWANNKSVIKRDKFSADFLDTFSIKFAEIKPLESEKEKFDKMKVARELKLITKKQALKEIYPNLPEEQLNKRIEELEEELKKEKQEMMSMGLTPGFSQLSRQQEGVNDAKMIEKANGGESQSDS